VSAMIDYAIYLTDGLLVLTVVAVLYGRHVYSEVDNLRLECLQSPRRIDSTYGHLTGFLNSVGSDHHNDYIPFSREITSPLIQHGHRGHSGHSPIGVYAPDSQSW
jgi:hypothetical protein